MSENVFRQMEQLVAIISLLILHNDFILVGKVTETVNH